MRTANPALKQNTFEVAVPSDRPMSITGTAVKTGVLLILAVITASWTWGMAAEKSVQATMPWMWTGVLGGVVFAIATVIKPKWAPLTAPFYALLQGLFLGAISAAYSQAYQGIVPQAVLLTFGVLACMLVAYVSGIVKATENFKLGVVSATGAIGLVYLVSIIANAFGGQIPYIHGSGIIGIGFSIFVVVIASLNLVLDFDFIERGAVNGAPKYMEWYGAFGLMVTLVWLYIEILRLLAKLNSRR
ncbi:putative membrane protein [Anaerohalosphaera lusitana]|uniref:Putative membrane protein n=1 Tax=Anaerohalosphaera lusitana TaxID=1936003 RepID=A0A1U9NN64_9BACT|nr:putative membrane protein [Anaerohalosphaera lusitana]